MKQDPFSGVYRALSPKELAEMFMNPNAPKTEAEHWAVREIEKLRAEVERLTVEFRSGVARGFVCRGCKNHFLQDKLCTTCGAEKLYDATVESQAAEIERLRAEVERIRKEMLEVAEELENEEPRSHKNIAFGIRNALEGKP